MPTNNKQRKRILYLLQRSPYLDGRVLEAFDALLVAAAFDQRVSLLFCGNGVTQLLAEQSPTSGRSIAKILTSLPIYEIEKVYAHAQAFDAAGLKISECAIEPTLLTHKQIGTLMAQYDMVLSD